MCWGTRLTSRSRSPGEKEHEWSWHCSHGWWYTEGPKTEPLRCFSLPSKFEESLWNTVEHGSHACGRQLERISRILDYLGTNTLNSLMSWIITQPNGFKIEKPNILYWARTAKTWFLHVSINDPSDYGSLFWKPGFDQIASILPIGASPW